MTEEVKKRIEDINNGIVPEGYKRVGKDIIPDDWEQRKLKDVAQFIRGSFPQPYTNKEFYDEENGKPFVQVADISFDLKLNEDTKAHISALAESKSRFVKKGTVIVALQGSIETSIGRTAITQYDAYVDRTILIFEDYKIQMDKNYFAQVIKSLFEKEKEKAWGATISTITKEHLSDFIIYVPKIEEQQQIGKYFKNLDTLITLHQRKCNELKNLKKAYLTKMFPQKGQKRPEIRFNGFTDDWEQRKVLDLLIQPVTDGPHETPKLVEDGVPFISVDAIIDNKIDFSRKRGNISEEYDAECCKKYKPQLYDVYLVKSGSTVGKVAIVETTERFNIWSPLAAMRCGNKTNPYFLYFLLQTPNMQAQVSDKASNGTQPNLSMRELEKFNTIVPTSVAEQEKIGNFFRELDNTITLHQRKLEAEKKKKKALMQLLLTGKVRFKV